MIAPVMIVDLDVAGPPERAVLSALRANHTPTVERGPRGTTYTTGLAQAEEMWDAADKVTPLASPILPYYAYLQACRAVIAASKVGNNRWQSRMSPRAAARFPTQRGEPPGH